MAKIVWDEVGEHLYETGTRHGVLYPKNAQGAYGTGVAWNGLTGVTESPSGAEETALYADDMKYLSLYSAEEFGGTIEAYTYPDEFAVCDGSVALAAGVIAGQQIRRGFGFAYRTVLGNDAVGEAYGYKLHIVYNAMASPSERSYATINDSPDAITFSWEFKTTPLTVTGLNKPTALITIDSTKVDATKLGQLEDILYGTENTEPRLPLPAEILEIFSDDPGPSPTPVEGYYEVLEPTGNPSTSGYYELTGEDAYTASEDVTVDAEKTYYLKGNFAEVEEPTGNPSTSGYYERESTNTFALSEDQTVVAATTYYTLSA